MLYDNYSMGIEIDRTRVNLDYFLSKLDDLAIGNTLRKKVIPITKDSNHILYSFRGEFNVEEMLLIRAIATNLLRDRYRIILVDLDKNIYFEYGTLKSIYGLAADIVCKYDVKFHVPLEPIESYQPRNSESESEAGDEDESEKSEESENSEESDSLEEPAQNLKSIICPLSYRP